MRLMTYNILFDGRRGRSKVIDVIQAQQPDLVFLQETIKEKNVRSIANALGMRYYIAYEKNWFLRVSALTNLEIRGVKTIPLWRRFGSTLRVRVVTPAGNEITVYGVHLMAYYMWFAEMVRGWQIGNLLKEAKEKGGEFHAMVGDFNTFAPGDKVSLASAPLRVRRQTWPQLGLHARWALRRLYRAGYTDTFRHLHPDDPGRTLPSNAPNVRLDYIFANPAMAAKLQSCEVVTTPEIVAKASDHLPVLATFDI